MSSIMKWIGGATALVTLFVGSAVLTGYLLKPDENAENTASLAVMETAQVEENSADASDSAAEGTEAEESTQPEKENADPKDDAAPQLANASEAPKSTPAVAPFTIKRVLPISGPIKYGEWHWDTDGVPDGPLMITVDLDARVISVFRDGYEIGAAAALLGTQEHPTPLGAFPILTKERHNVSEKYGNAPMPWTLRLTWDGIAIHGGSQVENGYASHGCIGVPDGFASRLFEIAKKGDTVVITRGKRIGVGDAIVS